MPKKLMAEVDEWADYILNKHKFSKEDKLIIRLNESLSEYEDKDYDYSVRSLVFSYGYPLFSAEFDVSSEDQAEFLMQHIADKFVDLVPIEVL